MKIQYLGTAAAEGIPAIFCECETCVEARRRGGRDIRTRSQAIIDDTLLIDFPADTYMHFLKYNIPLSKIESCLITHSHEDHLYPGDFEMRIDGFSHIKDKKSFVVYSDESGFNMTNEIIEKMQAKENELKAVRIKPFEAFTVKGGYNVMPIRASHDPKSSPVLFVIEKDGKSIFYANDSSEYNDESMACLRSIKKPIDLISLDCTEANGDTTYVGHLCFKRCVALRDRLIEEGIADKNTKFVLNHFSHNGIDVLYDDFRKIAEKEGFGVTYDGLTIEI